MARKYFRKPSKPKNTTQQQAQSNSTTTMADQKTNAEDTAGENQNNTHEQHKEFLKAAEDSVKKNANEPILETTAKKAESFHIYETPTIEREYTTQGIKKEPASVNSDAGSSIPPKPPTDSTASASAQNNFEPTPPPVDDPDYADTHNPSEEDKKPGFKIPAGKLEDMVDMGAKALNYLIAKFGGLLVRIKIKPEYHSIRDNKKALVDIITEFNDKAIEKLKLTEEEIEMIRGPLVKILHEKGITGTTPQTDLIIALLVVCAGKAKDIVEIKSEGKKITNHFDSMIRYMRGEKEPAEENQTPPKQTTSEEKIETVVAEEM